MCPFSPCKGKILALIKNIQHKAFGRELVPLQELGPSTSEFLCRQLLKEPKIITTPWYSYLPAESSLERLGYKKTVSSVLDIFSLVPSLVIHPVPGKPATML